jgi:dTDP-4-dehydrorhamnose reductase
VRRPVVVTGAAGFLGGEVLRRLRNVGTPSLGTWHEAAADGLQLDVVDAAAVDQLFRRVRPWAVVHTAYVRDGDRMDAVNASGSANVATAAARHGARLLHVSTDVVFDGTAHQPYTEDDPVCPVTPYGLSKAAAERLVAEAHPRALIVRTSLLYGAGGGPQEALLARALGGEEIAFFTDEVRCPIHVSDLAAALVELMTDDVSGLLHVAGPEAVTRYEFACLLAAAAGGDADEIRAAEAGRTSGRPGYCALDTTRAESRLQMRLRGVAEVLSQAADARYTG